MKNLLLSLGLCLGLIGCVGPQTRIINDPTKYKAAILVAEPSGTLEKLAQPFLGIYERAIVDDLRRELNVGTYIIDYSTTKEEFEQVLLDESIQVVVIAGHGSWTSWHAGDEAVTESYLESFAKEHGINKKKVLIRHTCGTGSTYTEFDPEKLPPFFEELKALGCENIELRNGGISFEGIDGRLQKFFNELASQNYGGLPDIDKLRKKLVEANCSFHDCDLVYLYCNTEGLAEKDVLEIERFVHENKVYRNHSFEESLGRPLFMLKTITEKFPSYVSRFEFDFINSVNFSESEENYLTCIELRNEYEQKCVEFYDKIRTDPAKIMALFDVEFKKYAEQCGFTRKGIYRGKIHFNYDAEYYKKLNRVFDRIHKEAMIFRTSTQFGECIAERVIGWDRITSPWDFIFNPLAK
ncbi:hypothetical protein HZA97_05305 [Candidatus Woesearchaeota archaeon]|nr:hypothetical protein [Candidatus Woesearchaeota archaeon]